ncbi:hypothetical protein V6N13_004932 [Hibiscus sabdariffa]
MGGMGRNCHTLIIQEKSRLLKWSSPSSGTIVEIDPRVKADGEGVKGIFSIMFSAVVIDQISFRACIFQSSFVCNGTTELAMDLGDGAEVLVVSIVEVMDLGVTRLRIIAAVVLARSELVIRSVF